MLAKLQAVNPSVTLVVWSLVMIGLVSVVN